MFLLLLFFVGFIGVFVLYLPNVPFLRLLSEEITVYGVFLLFVVHSIIMCGFLFALLV